MRAVMALERHGLSRRSGPVLAPPGASGPIASAIFSRRGFQVTASTGRPQEAESLGAAESVERKEFAGPAKPLKKGR